MDASETRWSFRPTVPWTGGRYEIIALSILEDLAGNQIGRAFEVDRFDAIEEDPDPQDNHDRVHCQVTRLNHEDHESIEGHEKIKWVSS